MRRLIGLGLVSCAVLALAAPALAQQPAAPRPATRGYASAFGGLTLETDSTVSFAGEYGERINRVVQAYATVSYFDNLLNGQTRDELDAISAALTALTASPWDLRGRDRGLALVVGAKFVAPTGVFRPYVGGGAGALNLKRTIVDATRGNISEVYAAEIGFGDGLLNAGHTSTTKPLAEATFGVAIWAGRSGYLDIGYRVRRVFHSTDSLQFSQVVVGAGMRF